MAQHASNEKTTLTQRFIDWCHDKSDAARLQRTIFQAIVIGCTDFVATLNGLPAELTAFFTVVGMPVLTAIMSEVGKLANESEGE